MAKDFADFNSWLSKVIDRTPELMENVVKEVAIRVDAEAKKKAPVDTGNLRASITMEVDGLEATVGTNVEYAPFIEFGTSRQQAQPFMTPAKQKVENQVDKILITEVKNYVRD